MTKEVLRNAVMGKLRIRDLYESPDPAIAADIEAMYDTVYLELKEDGLVTWGPTEDIPDAYALRIRDIVAAKAADDYAKDSATAAKLEAGEINARRLLRRQLTPPYVSTTSAEFY